MPNYPVYFTAFDITTFCAVDNKTVHNWADKGRIPHFRTPGRHLRFKPADVLAFLQQYGYDVPDAVKEAAAAAEKAA